MDAYGLLNEKPLHHLGPLELSQKIYEIQQASQCEMWSL